MIKTYVIFIFTWSLVVLFLGEYTPDLFNVIITLLNNYR